MSDLNETTFLQEGIVRITDRRTLIGTQTYPVSEIAAVSIARRARSKRPFWVLSVGILLFVWSIIDQTGYYREFFNWGIVLVVIGLALALTEKTAYVIQIRSASGVSDVLGSTDLPFIQRIVGAMNQAIARRNRAF